jgi:hypothetical protein
VNTTARTVAVEGFLSNTGDKPLCNITLNIQDFDKATQFWGDWYDTHLEHIEQGRAGH